MPRAYEQYLRDIRAAVAAIRANTDDLTYDDFADDLNRVKVVLFDLMIIGEACHHLPEHVRQRSPDTEWEKIVGLRNVIVHGYWQVKVRVIWETVTKHIAPLTEIVDHLLSTPDEESE